MSNLSILKVPIANILPDHNEKNSYRLNKDLVMNKAVQFDVCKYYGIPATLINVDEKYHTNTFLDVLNRSKFNSISFLINTDLLNNHLDNKSNGSNMLLSKDSSNGNSAGTLKPDASQSAVSPINVSPSKVSPIVSVIDPRSHYFTDSEFDSMINLFSESFKSVTKIDPSNNLKVRYESLHEEVPLNGNASKSVVIDFPDPSSVSFDTDNGKEDFYKKQIILSRLPQGGVSLNSSVLRLACTNGMYVRSKDLSFQSRVNLLQASDFQSILLQIQSMDIQKFFHSLFFNKGKLLPASVSDFMDMSHTLSTILSKSIETPASLVDSYFPIQPIFDFYAAQDIDITTINSKLRSRMPSGLSYFEVFNFLTNGVKRASNLSLSDMLDVSKYASPAKIRQLNDSFVNFSGAPSFDEKLVKTCMGDLK